MPEAPDGPSLGYRILIDMQGVQGPFNDRGVARTVAELSLALIRVGAPVAGLLLNPNLPAPPSWFPELVDHPLLVWATAPNVRRLQAAGPTVCFLPSPMEGSEPVDGVWPPFLAYTPFVPLIHDAIPYEDPVAYDIRHADRRLHTTRPLWLEAASHTLATTRYAAESWQTLVDPAPQGITVIGMGVSEFYHPAEDKNLEHAQLQTELPAITKPFMMYVGGDDERKNVDGALAAWAAVDSSVRQRFQFVIACSAKPHIREKWARLAAQVGMLPDDVVITDFVSTETLRRLYQTAELHFFPSLSEGFGMPIVESIACGCPVISSNTTSMPDIVGWLPGLFDPTDTRAMAALLTQALTDDTYRHALHDACQRALAGHSWDAAAVNVIGALDRHVPAKPTRPAPMRLAVVGPSGDRRSEVHQLVDDLRTANPWLEIDVFDDRPSTDEIIHYPVAAFGRTLSPGNYDERLYVLTDATDNGAVARAAVMWPGTAWLIDDTLTITTAADPEGAGLEAWYGDRLPSAIRHANCVTNGLLDDHHILGTADIVARSVRTLTNTAEAARAVELDAGPWRSVDVSVVGVDAFPGLHL